MSNMISTCHFVDFRSALSYYRTMGFDAKDVFRKVKEKEIFLGSPIKKRGYGRYVDSDGRYHYEKVD